MGRYIKLPITSDPAELRDQAYAYLQSLVPGWQPAEGNLDTWILQIAAQQASDLREFATDIPEEIFRYFLEDILLVQRIPPTYASFLTTWTAIDTLGHVIPAGRTVGVRRPTGEMATFQTMEEYTIPVGLDVVADVPVIATEEGSASSGLATDDVILIDTLQWVQSIVGQSISTGGSDGETDDEFMDRGVDEIRLMAPRPITPDDFASFVQRIAGIDRGYALNLYDAVSGLDDQEKTITIVVTDVDGEPVSAGQKTDAVALLESYREVNFNVYVRDPQYQDIDVDYTVMGQSGVDPAALEDLINATLEEYISPIHWGEIIRGTERQNLFKVENMVRYLEVATVINNVTGVDYIESLGIALGGDVTGTADVDMTPVSGIPVVLPRIGAIDGTVNLPT